MAGSAPKTIQSSTGRFGAGSTIATNTKSFENFSYFLGGIDVTHQNLDQFTPYIRGISRIFLHKPPLFMLSEYPDRTKSFKTYIETGYRSIDGIGDIDVSFTDFEGGFAGQRFSTPQLAQDQTDTITIAVYELTGSPIREYIDTWVTGVRDPRSGIAHYHGAIESGRIKYGEINHTAEFIYVTYDPTGLTPEYCCMFAHCFPKNVPKAHLNYETGNRDNAQMDLQFSTTKYESPAINDIGIWYTLNSKVKWNYLDFDPEQTNKGYMGASSGNVYSYSYGSENPGPNVYKG